MISAIATKMQCCSYCSESATIHRTAFRLGLPITVTEVLQKQKRGKA